MRDIDQLFHEQLETDKNMSAMTDDFSFVDSLVDKNDLDKINDNKEGE